MSEEENREDPFEQMMKELRGLISFEDDWEAFKEVWGPVIREALEKASRPRYEDSLCSRCVHGERFGTCKDYQQGHYQRECKQFWDLRDYFGQLRRDDPKEWREEADKYRAIKDYALRHGFDLDKFKENHEKRIDLEGRVEKALSYCDVLLKEKASMTFTLNSIIKELRRILKGEEEG